MTASSKTSGSSATRSFDPAGRALSFSFDFDSSNTVNDSFFRNMVIRGNTIIYTPLIRNAPNYVMFFGSANNSLPTNGNMVDNIQIEDNKIYVAPGTPGFAGDGLIFGNSSTAANFGFTNFVIANNEYYNDSNEERLVNFVRGVGNSVTDYQNHQFRYVFPEGLCNVAGN